ncbi:MAG: pyridoxamine 5'-phosphate oxidase family protein [Clostridia bacterium]|nr:pyridoxamine 5'-phosphate oxidase family protein [Clostridia bacterium]
MAKKSKEVEALLRERFGKDSLIALATAVENVPSVRQVDAFYEDGAFYVLTYGLSAKMKQIEANAQVAVCGEWFTAHATGSSLGWFGAAENAPIAQKMRAVFAAWIDNGHTDLQDPNTCILRLQLTDGVLWSHGVCYEIDFT